MNISLIVNDSEAEQCVKALHHSFFESGDLSELTVDGENREIGNGSAMKLNNVWRPFATSFFPAWWSVWTNTGRWISEWFSFAIVSRKLTINPSTHSQWFFWFPNKHIYWPFPSVRLVWISMQMQHLLVLRTQVELHLIFYYKDTSWVAFTFLKKKNDVLIKRLSNEWIVEQFSRTLQNWWHLVFLHGFHNLWWRYKFYNIFHFCATQLEPFRLLIFCQTF